MFKKTALFVSVFLGISIATIAGGYNLQFKINGIPDKTVKLAYYFADKQYLKDTTVAQNGAFVFRGDEALPGGIYIVILPNNQYFEIYDIIFFHKILNLRIFWNIHILPDLQFGGVGQCQKFSHQEIIKKLMNGANNKQLRLQKKSGQT